MSNSTQNRSFRRRSS